MTYTPGPWRYQREEDAAGVFKFWSVSSDTPKGHTVRANVDTEPNARLIAAAPEMAALLERYMDADDEGYGEDAAARLAAARSLLDRIRGAEVTT